MDPAHQNMRDALRLLAGRLRGAGQKLDPRSQRMLDELDSGHLSPEVNALFDEISRARVARSGQVVDSVAAAVDDDPATLLQVGDVARRLGVSTRTVRRRTAPNGPLRAVRIGRSVRYRPDDVEQFMASQIEATATPVPKASTGRTDCR